MKNEWGMTNDAEELDLVCQWRDDAVADGWIKTPTYRNESIDRACTLKKDGWIAQILTRTGEDCGKWKYNVSVWGPDGLAIHVPTVYDFAKMVGQLRTCHKCGNEDVPTRRVGFAGRVCETCLPEQRKLIETPGWCD